MSENEEQTEDERRLYQKIGAAYEKAHEAVDNKAIGARYRAMKAIIEDLRGVRGEVQALEILADSQAEVIESLKDRLTAAKEKIAILEDQA